MVSRDTFQRWIVPYGKAIVELVRQYEKKTIMHYHGQVKEVLPDFVEMGPDGLHTIEAPPIGNCTMAEAFDITQNSMVLIGNIQYDCFRSYTADEMRAAVRDVIEECGDNRLILSPTAGPFDEDPPARLFENYFAFMEAGWTFGSKSVVV
jgi:uroporphyrinogen-III decarboxylase